uniref:Leucine zipper transcription factor-like protein 1 n=1 Tax=Strongyloides papillosus TaxID=174720 RepID=A0A0N5BGI6_STREA
MTESIAESPRFLNILESQDEIIEELMRELELCKKELVTKSGGTKRKGEILREEILRDGIMSDIQKKMAYVIDMVDDLQSQNIKLEKDVEIVKDNLKDVDKIKRFEGILDEMLFLKNEVKELQEEIKAKERQSKQINQELERQEQKFENTISKISNDLYEYRNENEFLKRKINEMEREKELLLNRLQSIEVYNESIVKKKLQEYEDNTNDDLKKLIDDQKVLIESLKKENEVIYDKMRNMDEAFQHKVGQLRKDKKNLKLLLKRHFDETLDDSINQNK